MLASEAVERGGLHVILTEYHESARIDRQLIGRSARQGDPGSDEALVALDDDLFVAQAPQLVAWLRAHMPAGQMPGAWMLTLLRRWTQRRAEARNRDMREVALTQDRRHARLLAFAGRGE